VLIAVTTAPTLWRFNGCGCTIVGQIDNQIVAGKQPELPGSAQSELQARTGDVFAGSTQAPEIIEPAKGFVPARGGGSLTVPGAPGMAYGRNSAAAYRAFLERQGGGGTPPASRSLSWWPGA
jgi:hypothetical protein